MRRSLVPAALAATAALLGSGPAWSLPAASSGITIGPVSLQVGIVSKAYKRRLTATGGSAPYGWLVTTGTLPPGLSLSTTGVISGRPTLAGTSRFRVKVIDSAVPPHAATKLYTLTVAPTGPYLTILLAHSAETMVNTRCRPLPHVITLEEQAATYARLGIHGVTGTVITSWPLATTDKCIVDLDLEPAPKPLLIASWGRLAAIAENYGWSFVAASRTYTDVTKLTRAGQWSEICGALADLRAHNLPGAKGLFAYPNNHHTNTIQLNVTAKCYLYGRAYSGKINILPVTSPYLVNTHSLNGGNCGDPSLPCYNGTARFRYTSPVNLAAMLSPAAGEWSIVQGYRFVTGAVQSDTLSWDCSSPNWREHWTSGAMATEVYCWSDWLDALSQIPASVQTVTPASMAGFRS